MNQPAILDTRETILVIAEQMFGTQSYAGTSLRAVIREARVNQAAINYHFGTKEQLFIEVVRRVAQPIVQKQLKRLQALEHSNHLPSTCEVLEAIIAPCIRVIEEPILGITHARFLWRCRIEPPPIHDLVAKEFLEGQQLALDLLQRILADRSMKELEWKFDLVITVMLRSLAQIEPMQPQEMNETIKRLVTFTAAGFES